MSTLNAFSSHLRFSGAQARIARTLGRLLALYLVLQVASCTTRHAVPPLPEELTRFVLVIQQNSDGQVSHSWLPAAEFELPRYTRHSSMGAKNGSIVLVSGYSRDCDQEHIDCFRNCMKRRLPAHLNHIKRGDGSKRDFCAKECLKEYMRCRESQNSRTVEVPVTHDAVDWLKENRKELLVGTVVIIAGVAFVTLSAGAGVVVLAPLVLMAG